MATPWSSQGSHILVGSLGEIVFPIAEARMVDMGRLAEATTSEGILRKKVLSDGQGNFSAPWDSDQDPADVGMFGGAEGLIIGIKQGTSGQAIPPFEIIIENVERVYNAVSDVLRISVTFYAQEPVPAPVPGALLAEITQERVDRFQRKQEQQAKLVEERAGKVRRRERPPEPLSPEATTGKKSSPRHAHSKE